MNTYLFCLGEEEFIIQAKSKKEAEKLINTEEITFIFVKQIKDAN